MDLVYTLLLDIILKFYAVASRHTCVKVTDLEILLSLYQICRWIKLNIACW